MIQRGSALAERELLTVGVSAHLAERRSRLLLRVRLAGRRGADAGPRPGLLRRCLGRALVHTFVGHQVVAFHSSPLPACGRATPRLALSG